jgi:hypothetical protein
VLELSNNRDRARKDRRSGKPARVAAKKIPRARIALRGARSKEFDSAKTRARIIEPSPKFRARGGTSRESRESRGKIHDSLATEGWVFAVARLTWESGGERREIKVTGQLTVGRSQTAGVYLDDKTLSREHTQFFVQGGRLFVKDLESKNGTYLNGALIKGDQPLKHGDRVKVGLATFTVVLEQGDAMPAVSAPLAAPAPSRPATHHPPARTTATAPAVERVRPQAGGPHWFAVFIYRVILVTVIVIVAYVSKGFFARFLSGMNS